MDRRPLARARLRHRESVGLDATLRRYLLESTRAFHARQVQSADVGRVRGMEAGASLAGRILLEAVRSASQGIHLYARVDPLESLALSRTLGARAGVMN